MGDEGSLQRRRFGTTAGGVPVDAFTLARGDVEVEVIGYGATATAMRVPDRAGTVADVVLGFADLSSYEAANAYFGATVGRYANRIAYGRFRLDGVPYRLTVNEGPHHLHGGRVGFSGHVWHAEEDHRRGPVGVRFTRTSPAGEEGYPGALDAVVTYSLPGSGELRIDYEATTDAATVVNLTHHSYLNLAGEGSGAVASHLLTIDADRFTPVDETLIPLGESVRVDGSPFDFRTPRPVGEALRGDDPQIRICGGLDHNFVLNGAADGSLSHAARLFEPASGRTVDLWTTEPGLQCYSGGKLDGSLVGKSGRPYGRFHGVALEPQHFPDSPNRPHFPSTVLRPGQVYRSTTIYRFGVQAEGGETSTIQSPI